VIIALSASSTGPFGQHKMGTGNLQITTFL
jgi:hypothetical protein